MAKIIYKKGCEGQNNLSSIEGIEIDLLNGQKALIYPKYTETPMLTSSQIDKWEAANETEVEALVVKDINSKTEALLKIGSPAAEWVSRFRSDKYGIFCLPSLIVALEIRRQREEIDELSEIIEGADLLRNCCAVVWSCSRCQGGICWSAYDSGCSYGGLADCSHLSVPTILHR